MDIDWEPAPLDATHVIICNTGGSWWIKLSDKIGYEFSSRVLLEVDWKQSFDNFFVTYDDPDWTIVERPKIKKENEQMITAKMLRDTYPHRQMRAYIDNIHRDLTVGQRAAKLGALVSKYIKNCNRIGKEHVAADIDESFVWITTPEGHNFWATINDYRPARVIQPVKLEAEVKPEKKAVPKPEKKPKVGWWG